MYQTAEQFALTMPDARVLMSDEPEMESSLHYLQLLLLVTCLDWYWRDRQDYFIGANLTIYFSRQQLKNRDFRGPDFFLVKNVSNHPRPSWVVWEEGGQYPNLIIELLSDSTAKSDRGLKKQLYQDYFRTPEYFWFSPADLEFQGYRLVGHQYEAIPVSSSGKYWSEELGLFLGIYNRELRYFTADEVLLPTPQEAAIQEQQRTSLEKQRADFAQQQANLEKQRADFAQQQANLEKQRADQLADQLRSLGIDPQF